MTTLIEALRLQALLVAEFANARLGATCANASEATLKLEEGLREWEHQRGLLEALGPWDCDDGYAPETPVPEAHRVIVWRSEVRRWISEIDLLVRRLSERARDARPPHRGGEQPTPEDALKWSATCCEQSNDMGRLSLASDRLSGLARHGVLPADKQSVGRSRLRQAERRTVPAVSQSDAPNPLSQPEPVEKAAQAEPPFKEAPQAVPQYLWNWREILDALKMPNNKESIRRVREANQQYDGPIILPSKGGQPKVIVGKLLEWWSKLEEQIRAREQERDDTKATLEEKYNHGRDGVVLPDISGHVKKRRRKKKDG